MLYLPKVSLVAVEGVDIEAAVKAINISTKEIKFGSVWLLSTEFPKSNFEGICSLIPRMDWVDYNRFMLFKLRDYVETDFVLTIQPDGFVQNPQNWSDDFLKYDYVGARWENHHIQSSNWVTEEGKRTGNTVGNGGFSIRSKKLLDATKNAPYKCDGPEDAYICLNHYDYFIEKGLSFAPGEVADRFSEEGVRNPLAFGFHGDKNKINDYSL